MPKKVEARLKVEARRKFGSTTSDRARRYIYGTMEKRLGWRPGKKGR